MTSRDFAYWLQGFFEVARPDELDAVQTDLIKKHLALVFIHEIDPSFPQSQQNDLNQTHSGNGGNSSSPPTYRC